MKSFTVILLIALISSTIATTKSRSQNFLGKNPTVSDKLKEHHLGRALLSMAQVHSNEGYSLEDLYEALNLLRQSLNQKITDENAAFESEETQKIADEAAIQKKIDKFSNNIDIFNGELDDLESTETELAEQKSNLSGSLSSAQSSESEYQGKLAKLESDTKTELADFDDAIELLGQAKDKLHEAKQNADAASFIEMKKTSFVNLAEKFESKLAKIEKVDTLMGAQIARAFAQIASGNATGSDSIQNAIDALDNLIQSMQQGRIDTIANYESTKDSYQTVIGQLQDQISRLQLVTIPANQQAIEDNDAAIQAKEKQISTATSNKEFEEGQMEDLLVQWQMRVNIHDAMIPQLEEELEIVNEAEAVVRASE